MDDLFPVKVVSFLGRDVATLGQNEFGPCALLGVVNALLLRNRIALSPDVGHVPLKDLLALLADRLLTTNQGSQGGDDDRAANLRKALDEAISRLPTLAQGLDVNVKFGGKALFEFTPELALFDALDVQLVHGWRVDAANDPATTEALGDRAYNEVIEKVVAYRSAEASEKDADGALLSTFLEQTASQLTYAGLAEVHAALREREIAVLYRNLHFSTVFRYEGALYTLVTDAGYRDEKAVVWERLDAVDGDTDLCGADFRTAAAKAETNDNDPDHLLALQMAREAEAEAGGAAPAEADADLQAALALSRGEEPGAAASLEGLPVAAAREVVEDPDALLARQLQAEEDAAARRRPAAARPAAAPAPAPAPARKKKSATGCVVA